MRRLAEKEGGVFGRDAWAGMSRAGEEAGGATGCGGLRAWGRAGLALGGASIGTFMVKTLRHSLVAGSGSFTPGFMTEGMGSPGRKEQKKKQNYMLYAVALAQFPFLW